MDTLLVIQTVHTVITAWNFFSLLYIIYAHARSINGFLLRLCYLSILVEAAAIIPFGFTCPLRLIVDHYYSPRHNDILAPVAYVKWIMPAGIVLFFTGQTIRLYKRMRFKASAGKEAGNNG